jgi:DnaJ family protein C protein 3
VKRARREMQVQRLTACYESALRFLRWVCMLRAFREMRAGCALRARELENAVRDFSRLTHLRSSTTPSGHLTIFRLSYVFLPAPLSPSKNPALTVLKQYIHLDLVVASFSCTQIKALDKGFIKLEGTVGRSERGTCWISCRGRTELGRVAMHL